MQENSSSKARRVVFLCLICILLYIAFSVVVVFLIKPLALRASEETLENVERRAFIRAAVVYFPLAKAHRFLPQLRWFLRSWEEMRQVEPADWRTDVVVVSDGMSPQLKQLNCSPGNKRKSRVDPSACVVISNYIPASKRSEFLEIHHYPFADSILALAVETDAFDHYDWLLRTDLDTFLTEGFATWSPPRMVVGRGSFCFSGYDTCARLHNFARRQNLSDAGVENVGSGWYGPTAKVRKCARMAGELMVALSRGEFSAKEKEPTYYLGAKGWPGWHYGVLSMYAGQVAINSCAGSEGEGFDSRRQLLDFPSSSAESPRMHPHLHAWQDDKPFSKAAFASGKYDRLNLTDLHPLDSSRDYATWNALVGNKKRGQQPLLRSPRRSPNPFNRSSLSSTVSSAPAAAASARPAAS